MQLFIKQIIQKEKDYSCPWSANVIYLSFLAFRHGFWPYPINKATPLIWPIYFGHINGLLVTVLMGFYCIWIHIKISE